VLPLEDDLAGTAAPRAVEAEAVQGGELARRLAVAGELDQLVRRQHQHGSAPFRPRGGSRLGSTALNGGIVDRGGGLALRCADQLPTPFCGSLSGLETFRAPRDGKVANAGIVFCGAPRDALGFGHVDETL